MTRNRRSRETVLMIAMAWASPVLVILCSIGAAMKRAGWRERVLTVSLCGNALFAFVLYVGFAFTENVGKWGGGSILAPDLVQRSQGPLFFCDAVPESELARIVPHAVYVTSNRLVRVRVEFTDQSFETIREITISDKYGRPWVDANLQDNTMIYSRYEAAADLNPQQTLSDEDGDGIPDRMVDWKDGKGFQVSIPLTWVVDNGR